MTHEIRCEHRFGKIIILPVRSNAEMNVATRRPMMINQKRMSLGVALALSSSWIVSSIVLPGCAPSRSLDAVVGSDGGADISCALGGMALASVGQ
jgi:hypothetical protein